MKKYKARCMKCKRQVDIHNPTPYKMKNKMMAMRGTHKTCGTKVFRITGKA